MADLDAVAARSARSKAAAAGPAASGSTSAMPLRTVATSELVVPRSMPTARRCACGAGDSPGSAICSSAISRSHLGDRRVDVGRDLRQELQLAHRRARGFERASAIELVGEHVFELVRLSRARPQQGVEPARIVARWRRLVDRLAPLELLLEEIERQRGVGFRQRVDAVQREQILRAIDRIA